MTKEEKEMKEISKEASKLREAFSKSYKSLRNELDEANTAQIALFQRLHELSKKVDNILGFIESFVNNGELV